MKKFKLMMSMNRFKLLLCMTIVAAVTVHFSGINAAYAAPASTAAKADVSAENKTPRALAAAARARAKRAEMLKQREAARKYIQTVVESQQSQGATGTDKAGKGATK